MNYLIFSDKNAAKARSQELLEARLGRAVASDDLTTHLFSWCESELTNGGSVLIVSENDGDNGLSSNEQNSLVGEDEWATWVAENRPDSGDSAEQGLRYIKYRAKGSATARSRELYLEQLGRPLEPGESAKLLFPCEVSSRTLGGSVIVFNGNGAEFTAEEARKFKTVGDDDWIQWQAKYQPVPVT